jgi:hypothetical protein
MKILIGIPTYDKKEYCWKELVKSLKELKIPLKDSKANIYVVDTSEEIDFFKYDCEDEGFIYKHIQEEKRMDRVIRARNEIIRYALEKDYDYILFVDSDVILPKNTLEILLIHSENIVSGTYIVTDKLGVPTPAAKIYIGKELANFPDKLLDNKTHEVDLVGMGCCLVPKKVFSKIRFRCERGEYGDIKKAEDVCYCEDALKQGFKILLDTSLLCTHRISIDSDWEGKDV